MSGVREEAGDVGDAGAPHLRRTLGLPGLTLFGLTYLAPVTVFTTYGIVTSITDGHLATAYVVALVAMMFTALSYGRLSREYPVAGSAYTYTQQSFGGGIGFVTGWTLMLDYLLLPMINFLLIGIYLHTEFPAVPQWVFVLVALFAVLVANILGVDFISRISSLVVGISVLLVVLFIVLGLRYVHGHGGPQHGVFAAFGTGGVGLAGILSGAAVLALSFLGFDAVSTMSEEARHPKRDIPRAIMLTTLLGGLIFVVTSWAGQLVFPDWRAFPSVDSASVDLMKRVGGEVMNNVFIAVYVIGAAGSGLASQASVSRIIYSMGRDGVLPRPLAYLHPRFQTPVVAAGIVSAVASIALWISLTDASTMISFGALAAFSMVNLSVIKHYVVDKGRRTPGDIARYGVLPLVGFGLTVWLWTSLTQRALTIGLIWLGVGVVYLVWLTRGFRRAAPRMEFAD